MIQTDQGILPARQVETKIVLNFYDKGVHERLDQALELVKTLDEPLDLNDYEIKTVTIYETNL